MSEEKVVTPDVIIELTDEQKLQIEPLTHKRKVLKGGLIFGSIALSGNTVALSFIPQKIGEQIRDLAFQELGRETDVNS